MITPGTRITGFCNGFFGRDSYFEKLIIASGIWGTTNWCVAEEDGRLLFAEGFSDEQAAAWERAA